MAESDVELEVESRRENSKKKKKKLTVEMSALTETSDRIAPVVGYFSSGYNPYDSIENPEVCVFRNKKHRSSHMELVVKPKESPNVEFVAKSYEGEAAVHQPCHYALGILDKDTKTLKIVQIAANKIFRLEPRVLKRPSAEDIPGLSGEGFIAGQSARKMSDLTSLYGSKKQRILDKKWRSLLQQTNDPSARENLSAEMLDADINKEALKDTKEETAVHNIPPHDLSAVTPEKAYLLDEIILKGERDYLYDILELLQSGIGEKTSFWEENYYPSFVVNRIHHLRQIRDEEEKVKHAFILSYITHLINFWKLVGSSYRSASSHMHSDATNKYRIPRIVYLKFMKLFVDPVSNMLSTDKRELMIGYILVLTLFVDKFCSDPSDIARDLGMTMLDLRIYYAQLGCKKSRDADIGKFLWTLPAPLKSIGVKRKRRRQM